jgi:cytoskeletal protein CcmA (bactofilin family)
MQISMADAQSQLLILNKQFEIMKTDISLLKTNTNNISNTITSNEQLLESFENTITTSNLESKNISNLGDMTNMGYFKNMGKLNLYDDLNISNTLSVDSKTGNLKCGDINSQSIYSTNLTNSGNMTINGNLNVNGKFNLERLNILDNGDVKIRADLEAKSLLVNKDANITGNSNINGSLKLDGSLISNNYKLDSTTGNLNLTGDITSKNINCNDIISNGSLKLVGDIIVNTNRFSVDANTGNTNIYGSLNAGSTSVLNLTSLGDIKTNGLQVSGNVNIGSNKVLINSLNGNTNIAGNLNSGNTTVASLVSNGNISISGNTLLSKTLLLGCYTTNQMNNIQNPINGMIIYNTNTNSVHAYQNKKWTDISTLPTDMPKLYSSENNMVRQPQMPYDEVTVFYNGTNNAEPEIVLQTNYLASLYRVSVIKVDVGNYIFSFTASDSGTRTYDNAYLTSFSSTISPVTYTQKLAENLKTIIMTYDNIPRQVNTCGYFTFKLRNSNRNTNL